MVDLALCRRAAFFIGLAAPLATSLPSAAQSLSWIEGIGAGPRSYAEIVSDLPSPIPCIDGSTSPFCGDDYDGFTAFDFDATGASVAGTVRLSPREHEIGGELVRNEKAAIWKPGDGIIVLTDNSEAVNIPWVGPVAAPGGTVLHHRSGAADISAAGDRIAGSAVLLVYNYQNFFWHVPLAWDLESGNWAEGRVMAMVDLDDLRQASTHPSEFSVSHGGANAISDNGAYVAGWNGAAENGSMNPQVWAIEAVRWSRVGNDWVPQLLSPDDDGLYSTANDVNDAGEVVGRLWTPRIGSVGFSWQPGDGTVPDTGLASLTPMPMVWTDGVPMRALSLTTDEQQQTYDFGEARAISNGGQVAVGWVDRLGQAPDPAPLGPHDPFSAHLQAAAWINTADGSMPNWSTDRLLVLGTPAAADNARYAVDSTDGSMAEAVDASGRFIVGTVFYRGEPIGPQPPSHGPGSVNQAAFWELDEDFNLVRGTLLEDALRTAGVPMADESLMLERATAVRVVLNEAGEPDTIYLSGDGRGSHGSWLAILSPGGGGVTDPGSLLPTIGVVERGMAGLAGGLTATRRCSRPAGTSAEDQPWCAFVSGSAGIYVEPASSGGDLGKHFGLAHYVDQHTSAGATLGVDLLAGTIAGGSLYRLLAAQGSIYAAHLPDEGLRVAGSVALGRILDASFERVYVNGAGTAVSRGSTTGWGIGLVGELGYGIALDERTWLTPFVKGEASQVALTGWSDAGGPFNADFAAAELHRLALTAGIEIAHAPSDDLKLLATLSWTASRDGGAGVNAVLAGNSYTLQRPAGPWSILSAGAGFEFDLDDSSRLTGQAGLSTDLHHYLGARASTSYNRSF